MWKETHGTCLFQSEECVSRASLEDAFDQGEWESFNTGDCYGRQLSEVGRPEQEQNYNLGGVWRLQLGSGSVGVLSEVSQSCSPRWQYQVSERSPLFPTLVSMTMVDDGRERETWKGQTRVVGRSLFLGQLALAGGCGAMRSRSSATMERWGRNRLWLVSKRYSNYVRVRDKDKQKGVHLGKGTGAKGYITAVSLFMLYSKSMVLWNVGQLSTNGRR